MIEELRPGLGRWTAVHPDWTPEEGGPEGWEPEVASYLYEASDAIVLFDPLVGDGAVWADLDERVEKLGPPHVLVTLFWHVRSTPAIAERYPGTRVWAHDREPWITETRNRVPVTDPFQPGQPLPAGIDAREPREVVYWIPEHRALVAGDVLLPAVDGGVRACPWLGERMTAQELRANLRTLLELPIELILLTHGEPVVQNARAALERALDA